MAMLRAALTDEDLQSLLDGSYTPDRPIEIQRKVKPTTGFAEDSLISIRKIKRKPSKGGTPKKAIPPSKRYEKALAECENGEREPDAEVVLAYYFGLYKRYFHEEDPDWAGASTQLAINMIDRMARELTDGEYRKIVIFVRKFIPLWVNQLKANAKFPTNRPTIQTLFSGKRYFWANRNILIRQWQRR